MQFEDKLEKTAEMTYLQGNKQQTRCRLNIFGACELTRKVKLMFRRPKDRINRKCYVFRSYKQRNKVFLLYLESKLQ